MAAPVPTVSCPVRMLMFRNIGFLVVAVFESVQVYISHPINSERVNKTNAVCLEHLNSFIKDVNYCVVCTQAHYTQL